MRIGLKGRATQEWREGYLIGIIVGIVSIIIGSIIVRALGGM